MKIRWAISNVVCLAAALAWPAMLARAAQVPQPAVARIIVAERDGASLGSGVLVAVDGSHGLVVTNWHVVRDVAGPITVVFPDGFRSGALLLMTDQKWDLAALAIQKPNAQPLPLAAAPPQPGEPLAIAGYGPDGVYRAVGGRCTKYLSPDGSLPNELVEVDVEARRGDSGGPIYNSRGEVAGILFGAGSTLWSGGYTMGSYCGRVRQFLAASYVVFQRLPGNTPMVAQAPAPTAAAVTPPQTVAIHAATGLQGLPQPPGFSGETAGGGYASTGNSAPQYSLGPVQAATAAHNPRSSPPPGHTAPCSPIAQVPPAATGVASDSPISRTEQVKSVLAVVGIIAILFHGLRLIASAVG